MILPLADLALALHGLIVGIVQFVSFVIVVYVLLDLARYFIAGLPEIARTVHTALGKLCEPLFMPIRQLLPPMGGIDFSPMITLVLIQLVGYFIANLLV
jgi:YggT family protein